MMIQRKGWMVLGCFAILTAALTCGPARAEETNAPPTLTPAAAPETPAVTNAPPAAEPAAPEAPVAETPTPTSAPEPSGWQRAMETLAGHIEIGVAYSTYELSDNDRTAPGAEHFLGSIDELVAEDDSQIVPVLGWYFNRYVGIEGRLEEIKARAYTDSEDNHSDGTYVVKGPVASVVGRLPLDILSRSAPDGATSAASKSWLSRVVPFAGIGYTFFSASFDAEAWWAKGYSSPEAYASLGSPDENRKGYYRDIEVSNDQGFVLMAGIQCRLMRHLSLDFSWSRTELDLDTSFSLAGDHQQDGAIPIHYDALTLGARYCF